MMNEEIAKQLRHCADWLDRRRSDKLFTNSAAEIEVSPKEMEELISVLRDCADLLCQPDKPDNVRHVRASP